MRSATRLALTLAAFLLAVPLAWADCCSVPLVGGQGFNEQKLIELMEKVFKDKLANSQIPMNNVAPPNEPNPNENSMNMGMNELPNQDGMVDLGQLTEPQNIVGTASFGEEPVQRAVISWNRVAKKEILSLEVYHKTNFGKGSMLSFMPLSGPVTLVKQGDKDLFKKAHKLVMSKQESAAVGVAPVQYETAFGAHQVFVWLVDNEKQFFRKIQDHVRKKYKGQAVALFNKETENILNGYFKKGYKYFLFDIVQCDKLTSKREAIEIHFNSNMLFYPVEITGGGASGDTKIELIAFTDSKGLNQFQSLPYNKGDGSIKPFGKTVKITSAEMTKVHPGMAQLFDANEEILGRIWIIRGDVDLVKGDVAAVYKAPA